MPFAAPDGALSQREPSKSFAAPDGALSQREPSKPFAAPDGAISQRDLPTPFAASEEAISQRALPLPFAAPDGAFSQRDLPLGSATCGAVLQQDRLEPPDQAILVGKSRAESEKVLAKLCRNKGGKMTNVTTIVDLSSIPPPPILTSSSPSISSSFGASTIYHHISLSRLGRQHPINSQRGQDLIVIPKTRLKIATYNLRGIKRFGRQAELSHLLDIHRFDFIGLQETKCTGNTISTLAAGFLLNSSENPFPGKEEHRGTGLVFRRTFASALRKTYQGSSRWCGAVFLAKPVPLLILSVYAPTAAADPDTKDKFYQEIREIIAENGGAFVIILGDFNARILENPGLQRHIGANILKSAHPLGHHSEDVLDNRERFLDFLVQQDLVAVNTLREGPPETQITYRLPGQPAFEPPWIEDRYAQIDYILTKSRWRNLFSNVGPKQELDYDSDHLPLNATISGNWHFGTSPRPQTSIRHNRFCSDAQKRAYNADIKEHPITCDDIQTRVTDSATKHRGLKQPDIKKHYLKDTTIAILRQRDEAMRLGQHAHSRVLTAQFRHQAKRDRKDNITEQLRTFSGHQQNWPAIKRLRQTFFPRFSKRGTNKSSCPASFPNDCAKFFSSEHWKRVPPAITASPAPLFDRAHEAGTFSLDELNQAIDGLKPNKAGGPDALITELFKDLDRDNRLQLLQLYQEIYEKETIPDHFKEAHVVQIYKAGKTPEHFSSYRPIALLNITYKILAKMIQTRLRDTIDDRIVDFQYGFRQGRSTAEPIFIARRVQELAERHGLHLYMLALDYSKAFDSIPHEKLIECLHRIGAPQKMTSLVQTIYSNPRFRIKIPEGISDDFPQETGIRQGCPLSPYLYIIATSCLMTDLLKDFRDTDIDLPQLFHKEPLTPPYYLRTTPF